MNYLFFCFCLFLLGEASSQNATFTDVKNCVYDGKVFPDVQSPQAILITPLLQKGNAGVYAFRKKGPHNINMLVIQELDKCNVVPKDSSSTYVQTEIQKFSKRNSLSSKEQKDLRKKVQEYIIDFKESKYIN